VRGAFDQVAAGDASTLDATRAEALIDAYQRHIAREDAELLPMAKRLLGDAALQDIGRAMRERRGIRRLP
jgi:hemerythrin-like domain-containing protein